MKERLQIAYTEVGSLNLGCAISWTAWTRWYVERGIMHSNSQQLTVDRLFREPGGFHRCHESTPETAGRIPSGISPLGVSIFIVPRNRFSGAVIRKAAR